ncbi:MAG: efflux RND transporter permease subunit [Pseudomonadales bacterium]|nr:efflux RND transporter permease subunit [Pseudomonadales bacterium]
MTASLPPDSPRPLAQSSPLESMIRFCLKNKLVVIFVLLLVIFQGIRVAPFDWQLGAFPRAPVPTDAIPDIGENQQIVFTDWMGRSPQDVEDQITYPLTVSLMGIPGVKTIRSASMIGFSSIYIIFQEDVDFYWSRSRVLEKLNSLPANTLPAGVQPALGPDATALGQVFWYTLEGRDSNQQPTGGWGLDELRSIQDWYVRYALLATEGISEVASVGGFVQEYQVDVDPDAMRAYGVTLDDVFNAVRNSNIDVGARSIEVNQVEYLIRGIGFIEKVADLSNSVVKVDANVPVYIRNVAEVILGPASRRGALDKNGTEAAGVVVVRYGENPLAAIQNVKRKIDEIAVGLPQKVIVDWSQTTRQEVEAFAQQQGFAAFLPASTTLAQESWLAWVKTLPVTEHPDWLTLSKVTIVPFYDRTGLIYETLGTLNTALTHEILITIIVVLIIIQQLGTSAMIAGLLPLAILLGFIAMKQFGVDANIVALSGIAIAIGVMVDMGIVISENILRRLEEWRNSNETWQGVPVSSLDVIARAASEVGSAVLTAMATTIVGFLPVLAMVGAEGKLFKPLALTYIFCLAGAALVALILLPVAAHLLTLGRISNQKIQRGLFILLMLVGVVIGLTTPWWAGAIIAILGLAHLVKAFLPEPWRPWIRPASLWLVILAVLLLLTEDWLPLGPEKGLMPNLILVGGIVSGLLLVFYWYQRIYPSILRRCLEHKTLFLLFPFTVILLGGMTWLGFERVFAWLPESVAHSSPARTIAQKFPGLGNEFMPPLDEGSYLYMPTLMAHASIGASLDVLQKLDLAIASIPEIDSVAGKLGRADSALDPADISMIESIINYKPQYLVDNAGKRLRFRYQSRMTDMFRDSSGNPVSAPDGQVYTVMGKFPRAANGALIPDDRGAPFRLWRPALDPELNPGRLAWSGIRKPDDIWNEIKQVADMPGSTSAPKLQPIAARIVMLQSGMRAPMGVKVKGPTLETIEQVGLQIEHFLKQVPSVEPSTVVADRLQGKPYLEIHIDRAAIARYGLSIREVQHVLEVAIGGQTITSTVEGRERYPVRVRYLRELRDQIDTLGRILVPVKNGPQIPLEQLAEIQYTRGPMVIRSEDTFLVGYVVFDMRVGNAEVAVVEEAQAHLQEKLDSGELLLPAGVSYTFSGSYENQLRAQQTLGIVIPLALFIIFFILYLQFKSVLTALLVFSGVFVAWAGGFILVGLYAQPWFLNFSLLGMDMRELFQVHPINLSVAVWVGFLALFGIATDNGVLLATFLKQSFSSNPPATIAEIRTMTIFAAQRKIRPALMTSATTILALLTVLTSTGRGADIVLPMAIPSFGGMVFALLTLLVVPVLYCGMQELRFTLARQKVLDP